MKPAATNKEEVIDFHDVEYASIDHTKHNTTTKADQQNTATKTTPTGMLLDVQMLFQKTIALGGAKNMGSV